MKLFDKINNGLYAPKLTRPRIVAAVVIAVMVDAIQLTQIPVLEQVLDVVAMCTTIWLVGFHLLLLPTFALEFLPFIDAFPTWTGCVLVVIALRGQQQYHPPDAVEPKDLPPSAPPKQIE